MIEDRVSYTFIVGLGRVNAIRSPEDGLKGYKNHSKSTYLHSSTQCPQAFEQSIARLVVHVVPVLSMPDAIP